MQEVVRLEEHVAELRVADALLTLLEPPSHGVFLDHHVDREVLSYIAEGVHERQLRQPVGIVHDRCSRRPGEVEHAFEDRPDSGHASFDLFVRPELPFGLLAGRVADEPGSAAHDRHRPVTSVLEAAQQEQHDEVADGERRRRRVEACVHQARPFGRVPPEPFTIRLLVDEPAVSEVVEQIRHREAGSIHYGGMPSDAAHLLSLDREHVWHPYASAVDPLPVYPVASAAGVRLRLFDGTELVGGMSSWWAAIHGYAVPELERALTEQ